MCDNCELYLNTEVIFLGVQSLKYGGKEEVDQVTTCLSENIHQRWGILAVQPSHNAPLCCLNCIVLLLSICWTSSQGYNQEPTVVRRPNWEEIRIPLVDFLWHFIYGNQSLKCKKKIKVTNESGLMLCAMKSLSQICHLITGLLAVTPPSMRWNSLTWPLESEVSNRWAGR